jgi:acyl-CoA synthetase (AMP-forming)/AMP-acid ligase II
MTDWLNLGQILAVNAKKYPRNIAFMDASRSFTFPEVDRRTNRLANALSGLGLGRGDKISCLLENCVEICELYVACAKIGAVLNPINFRVAAQDVAFIADNADSKAFFAHDQFAAVATSVRGQLPKVKDWFVVGAPRDGYSPYEDLVAGGGEESPAADVRPEDPWILLYTSGTTGRPKGVVRSHASYVAFWLINGTDFKYSSKEVVLTAMPLCHVNTTFFSFTATYFGGANYVHPAIGFDAREILRIVAARGITFISLIPTHYNMILAVPREERARIDVSSIRKLLCSSAPARIEQKQGIIEYFRGVDLYEGYGSTEAGIVTTLMPEDQLTHPGSIGQESSGTHRVRILDEEGRDVPVGQVGELYSSGPMMFTEYYKMPEETTRAFKGRYFSAGDMARMDEDGYLYLVDRKKNMIITGGEHVFPSEVEAVICGHPAVYDVGVIGLPDFKWTEAVTAVITLQEGMTLTEREIVDWCKERLARFKVPKRVIIVTEADMPRTATGKLLHRILKERYSEKG